MCDTLPGRLLLLADRRLEAAYTILAESEQDDIRIQTDLGRRLEELELGAVDLPFELFRLEVPEGSETWAVGRLHDRFRALATLRSLGEEHGMAYAAAPEHVLHIAGPAASAPGPVVLSSDHGTYKEMVGFDTPCDCRVDILVIDSGIAPDATLTPVAQRDFTFGATDPFAATDELGHGTVICEIIHDLLPNAQVTVYKVGGADRRIDEWDLLAALAAGSDAAVINLSVQFGLQDRSCPTCGRASHSSRSAVFEIVTDTIAGRPTRPTFVAAAGNASRSELTYPARFGNVVAISSATSAGTLSRFSNYGEFAHDRRRHDGRFAAPGGEHDAAGAVTEHVAVGVDGTRHAGTSFACAYATAVVGALRCHCRPALAPDTVRKLLTAGVDPRFVTEPRFGNGLLRRARPHPDSARVTIAHWLIRRLEDLVPDDPGVSMWIGVLDNDLDKVRGGLGRGADPDETAAHLVHRHATVLEREYPAEMAAWERMQR